MSTLLLNTLTGKTSAGSIVVTGEGGSTTTNMQQGLAKAWTNFNGTGTIAHRDSFNCGTLTDQGTGQYDINFTSNMASANHCPTANSNAYNATNNFNSSAFCPVGTSHSSMTGNTASNTSLGSFESGGAYQDAELNFVSVDGDLA